MPKNKVNNNIKLKSGGGIINDATDGLSISEIGIDGSWLAGSSLREFQVSDNLKISADAERTEALPVYTKVKEVLVRLPGSVRIKFDLKSSVSGQNSRGRIYKNGVAFGTERSTTSNSYTTYSEDLTFSAGDLIQLYIRDAENTEANVAYAKNFRIYYDEIASQSFIVNID